MSFNILIPIQLPQDEESKAFAYGQCLLVKKVTPASSPNDGYRQLVLDAQGAPFCSLEASATEQEDLTGRFAYAAGVVLRDVIPRNLASLDRVVAKLLFREGPLPLDSHTSTCPSTAVYPSVNFGELDADKLFTVTKPQKLDDPIVVETLFLSTPSWSQHAFDVCCIKVESRKEHQGMFERWTHQDETFHISGTCRRSRFSVNTRILKHFMKTNEDAEENISSFLQNSRAVYRPLSEDD